MPSMRRALVHQSLQGWKAPPKAAKWPHHPLLELYRHRLHGKNDIRLMCNALQPDFLVYNRIQKSLRHAVCVDRNFTVIDDLLTNYYN